MKQLILGFVLILLSCLESASCRLQINLNATTSSTTSSPLQCDPADEAVLLSVKSSARFFSNWNTSQSCCSWRGVSCTPDRTLQLSFSGSRPISLPITTPYINITFSIPIPNVTITLARVTSLHTSFLLQNTFPNALCNLTSLHTLSLPYAHLSGPLPPCIGSRLTNLRHLDLSYNQFSGSFPPSFSSLHSLQSLNLSHNSLSGSIPPFFASDLQSLQSLSLKENQFSGSLSTIALLSNLTSLDLRSNSFSGTIPPFTSSPLLSRIVLYRNLLSGNITLFCALSNLPSLNHLDLSSNLLSQHIPPFESMRFPTLSFLDLSFNFFNGNLPPSLYCNLTSLNVQNNALSGLFNHSSLHQSCGQRLVQLKLNNNKFTGPFPAWIASLCKVQWLSFSYNFFKGTLPKLPITVEILELSHNQFTGPFPPWIGSLSRLWFLGLSHNRFVGGIPQSWQNLSSLSYLSLSGNMLMNPQSVVPPMSLQWLFKMPRLSHLSLSSVQLQPAHLRGYCNPLMKEAINVKLDLSDNNLTAESLSCLVPMIMHSSPDQASLPLLFVNISGNPLATSLDDPHVINLLSSRLWTLDLSRCQLKGHLHRRFLTRLQRLLTIRELYMSGNFLSGQIPHQLYNYSQLYVLDLSHNLFTRVALSKGSKLKGLDTLNLSNNKLTMSLYSLLSSILSFEGTGVLHSLDLSYNMLRGRIPADLLSQKCGSLAELKLNGNHLIGTIPSQLPSLKILSLAKNQLSGPLPPSFIYDLNRLVLLDLSHNNLTGDLQTALFGDNTHELHKISGLRVLRLGHNSFTGFIPTSIGRATPALQAIDFSNNFLTGYIPQTLGDLKGFMAVIHQPRRTLTWTEVYKDGIREEPNIVEEVGNAASCTVWLDVSGNNLSGAIPTGLGALTGITCLNMSRNRLSGPIPSDWGQLSQLQSLDLSCNELEGSIPQSFHTLHALKVFNVSCNKGLRGPSPNEQREPTRNCSAGSSASLQSNVMCKVMQYSACIPDRSSFSWDALVGAFNCLWRNSLQVKDETGLTL